VEKQTANTTFCIVEKEVTTGGRNMLFLLLQDNYLMYSKR
jgi:hypothetical protein